ncbi:MAG: hypothetical protein J2P47_12035 [Acetobacteraceae bacterium]|nr:hypothetical protein [Acetobacteraceae bacterium]
MPERRVTDVPIPLSPLGELAGWYLNVRCGHCGRRVMQKVADLATRHGARLPVWRLVNRLRCRALMRNGAQCGGKPDLVTLVQGRERRKDFLIIREILVLDDRPHVSD